MSEENKNTISSETELNMTLFKMKNEIEFIGGLTIVASILGFLALLFSLAGGGSSDSVEGVSGFDLRLAVDICKPLRATFEQELACTQAVYGNVPKQ